MILGSHCFLYKFVITLRLFQPPYCSFLWNKCFERSQSFTLPPQYHFGANTKISKQSYRILCSIIFRNLFTVIVFILWLFHTFHKWVFFEKLKLLRRHVFLHWWVFIKRTRLQSTLLDNSNRYVKVFIENNRFETKNTENTKRRKTYYFFKRIGRNRNLHKPV